MINSLTEMISEHTNVYTEYNLLTKQLVYCLNFTIPKVLIQPGIA